MHYYQFNIGDYSSNTQHLEPMEDLAYRRMLDLYYLNESPLPLDIKKIARLIRMRSHEDCIAIVLDEFFTKEKDGYRNNGADKVLDKVYKKSEAARRSAEARWNKINNLEECERNANASETHCEEDANGMLPNTQDPLPNTHSKKKSKKLDFSEWPELPSREVYQDWKQLRTKLKATVSQTVINRFGKELTKAFSMGYTVNQCLETCVYKGWRGFEADWMANSAKPEIKSQSQVISKNDEEARQARRDAEFEAMFNSMGNK